MSTSGLHYLSTQEGQQRLGAFCENIVVFGNAIDKSAENITAKDVAGAVGHIAGDILFTMGTSTVATFLKEIKALEIVSNEAKIVVEGLKTAIQEHPAFETAEGIVLKMSDGMKDVATNYINQKSSRLQKIFQNQVDESCKKMAKHLKIFLSKN